MLHTHANKIYVYTCGSNTDAVVIFPRIFPGNIHPWAICFITFNHLCICHGFHFNFLSTFIVKDYVKAYTCTMFALVACTRVVQHNMLFVVYYIDSKKMFLIFLEYLFVSWLIFMWHTHIASGNRDSAEGGGGDWNVGPRGCGLVIAKYIATTRYFSVNVNHYICEHV